MYTKRGWGEQTTNGGRKGKAAYGGLLPLPPESDGNVNLSGLGTIQGAVLLRVALT